jgi:hypothetical protein
MTKVGVTSSKNIWQDPDTGLIWQNDGNYPEENWEDAKQYCKNLTLDGIDSWRLPSKDEFKTIITKNKITNSKSHSHYIKKELVEKMPKLSWFWSSTEYGSFLAWVVRFKGGNDYDLDKSIVYYVLCVSDSNL